MEVDTQLEWGHERLAGESRGASHSLSFRLMVVPLGPCSRNMVRYLISMYVVSGNGSAGFG